MHRNLAFLVFLAFFTTFIPACGGSGDDPTCTDGTQNGDETGVDCGGAVCGACPTCTDGMQNGDETGVDCGGAVCGACSTCMDGTQNGDETGVDCGGTVCGACPTCTDGTQNGDETGVDCGGTVCGVCPTCTDGTQNGDEDGVDCGGTMCSACPTCSDRMQNGDETDVDCGGTTCAACCSLSVGEPTSVLAAAPFGRMEAAPVGDGWLVVYRTGATAGVTLQKLDLTGGLSGASTVLSGVALNNKSQSPNIAFNATLDEGLVVWSVPGAGSLRIGSIMMRRVDASGAALAAEAPLALASGGIDDGGAAIASTITDEMLDVAPFGTGYALVVAARDETLQTSRAVVAILDGAGAVVSEETVSFDPQDFVQRVRLESGQRGLSLAYTATNDDEETRDGVRFLKLDATGAATTFPTRFDGRTVGTGLVETATGYTLAASAGTSDGQVLRFAANGSTTAAVSYGAGQVPSVGYADGTTVAGFDDGAGALQFAVVDPATAAPRFLTSGVGVLTRGLTVTGNGDALLALYVSTGGVEARVVTPAVTCGDASAWDTTTAMFTPADPADLAVDGSCASGELDCCSLLIGSEIQVTDVAMSSESALYPRVTWNPTLGEYAVVWYHRQSESISSMSDFSQVRLARYDTTGTLLSAHLLYDDQVRHGNAIEPRIVNKPDGYYVVFSAFTKSGYMTFWDTYTVDVTVAAGTATAQPATMSGPRTVRRINVDSNNGTTLMSYFSGTEKFVTQLSASATFTGMGTAMSPANNNSQHNAVAVLLDGTSGLGVYNVDRTASVPVTPGLYATPVDDMGVPATAQLVQARDDGNWSPAVTNDGATGFFLGYTHRDPLDVTTQIYITRVDAGATSTTPVRITDAWGAAGNAQLDMRATTAFATWQQAAAGEAYSVRFQRVAADDSVPASSVQLTDGTSAAVTPTIAVGDQSAAVVFSDYRATSADLYLRILSCE
ncbi:MAG: hypothetical protein H6726_19290 [Sandaracinaceae bacterium]|nr:hypothetical protein [Sandaracinaceae bacterium]